jgi:hypothetical protein
LCVNSREVNFDEGFYPTDDVVYFISPKIVLEQLGELWYLILYSIGCSNLPCTNRKNEQDKTLNRTILAN